jgi:molybdopterin molybdotransferase
MTPDTATTNVSRDPGVAKRVLVSVNEARRAMLEAIPVLPSEKRALASALGCTLAKPVRATRDQPPYDGSAMDGYAVHSKDTPGRLELAGESAAGRAFSGKLGKGEAARISTGAPLPEGADSVVIQEDVERGLDHVIVPAAAPGKHVRRRGLDFTTDTLLLEQGRRLDGVALALAAAAGVGEVCVHRAPHVALLCSGDELVPAGTSPGPLQIFDSATPGIAGLIAQWGGIATRLAIERDDPDAIARAAERGLRDHDLLVVIGGASVGDHDHAKPALARLGTRFRVDGVALRPGKPSWFGANERGAVLGLPGNPASALVCAHLFLRPIIERMQGRTGDLSFLLARLAEPLPANGPREHYLRARLSCDAQAQLHVSAFEAQDSSLLSVFSAANALIRISPGAAPRAAGELVDVLMLGSPC